MTNLLTIKIKKYLSNTIWYHATTLDGWKNICHIGVKSDYNKETSDDLDFGHGFYMTNEQKKAENYIKGLKFAGVLSDNDIPVIIAFECYPLSWFEDEIYKTHIMNAHDDEFALFVFTNRTENKNGEKQHHYDAIFGVMSDSIPVKTIYDYKVGILTKEQVLESFKKTFSTKQLSLHNQELCDIIRPQNAYTFDILSNDRKELNIDEYYCR